MSLDVAGLGAAFDFAGKVIDKLFPDKDEANKAKLALVDMQQRGDLAALAQDFQIAIKQGDINIEEAKNPSWFISGWRPFIGWICGVALAYNYVFMPLLTYLCRWASSSAPEMPALENTELVTLLFGMLGLGGMRMTEKIKRVARE